MRKLIQLICICLALFSFSSCEKDLDSANVSKITYFPVLTMKGDQFVTITKGATFTDLGVTSKLGDQSGEVKVSGSVDPNTIGVYTLTYTSTNPDGFSSTTQRYVGVVDPAVSANDFSGSYARNTNGVISVWTKVSTGLYKVTNVGGSPSLSVTVYVYNLTGNEIKVPLQETSNGPLECNPAHFDSSTQYSWIVLNASFGTALRTFVKL